MINTSWRGDEWTGIAQSVWWLATSWMGQGSNPSGGEIFRTHPDWPWGPPSLLYNGYRVFPGVKWTWRGIHHPPPSSAEVKERVELYLCSTSGPSWPVLGWTLPLQIWCHFDRASSLICENKMPTRCNRGFYCRSYCLLNMFRAPLCPSSGAQEYYTVVTSTFIQLHPTNRIPDPTDRNHQALHHKILTKNTHTQPPRHSTHLVTNLDNTHYT